MKKAFTLAETLITLTVIGFIAALMLPSVMVNVNEKVWDSQRKGLLTRMQTAFSQIENINGYGEYQSENADEGIEGIDTQTETFVANVLAKVYKIKAICPLENGKCGLSESVILPSAKTYDLPKKIRMGDNQVSGVGIKTINGESLAVWYNRNCTPDSLPIYFNEDRGSNVNTNTNICVNFIYDLNGDKKPNAMGKDMGVMSVIYDGDSNQLEVVAPRAYYFKTPEFYPFYSESGDDALTRCTELDKNLTLPSKNELYALMSMHRMILTGTDKGIAAIPVKVGKDYLALQVMAYDDSATRTRLMPKTETSPLVCVYE